MNGDYSITANFAINTYTITGKAGIAGATLTYTGGSTTAGSDGSYTIHVSFGWSGTVTPSKTGYVFVPDHITYPSLSANQPSQNYTAFVPTMTDDNSYILTYQNWMGKSDAKASGGGYHYSSTAGQTAAYTTTVNTTSITLLTYKGPDQGKVQILVDNVSKGTFDLYNKTALYKQSITITGLLSKKHTLTVKVLGQKNPLSTGTQVRLDAIKVAQPRLKTTTLRSAITVGSAHPTSVLMAAGIVHPAQRVPPSPSRSQAINSIWSLLAAQAMASWMCTRTAYSLAPTTCTIPPSNGNTNCSSAD